MRTRGRPAPTGTAGAKQRDKYQRGREGPSCHPRAALTLLQGLSPREVNPSAHVETPRMPSTDQRVSETSTRPRAGTAPGRSTARRPPTTAAEGKSHTHTITCGRIPAARKSTAGQSTGRKEVQGGGENEGGGASF